MNWLFIIVSIGFLIGLIVGFIRGAIKIAVSLLATVITFVLVFFATPYVSKGISTVTPIQDVIETKVESMIAGMVTGSGEEQLEAGSGNIQTIRDMLNAAGIGEEQLNALGITLEDIAEGRISTDDLADMGISRNILDGLSNTEGEMTDVLQSIDIPRDTQIAAIENADIPEIFKNLLLTNNNSEIYDKLEVTSFPAYVARYTAKLIVNIIAFLLTFIVVTIILRAIIFSLNVISDLPVLGLVNRLAGGALGMVGALIIVWVAFVIITMLYTTEIGGELFAMIRGNSILTAIYEYNPIMRLATTLR